MTVAALGTKGSDPARVVRLPDIHERLTMLMVDPVGGTSEKPGRVVASDVARRTAVARSANIKNNQPVSSYWFACSDPAREVPSSFRLARYAFSTCSMLRPSSTASVPSASAAG